MEQQQIHPSIKQPDTSQKQHWQRRLVTFVLLLALGATVGILIRQGVISASWLVSLPWLLLTILVLVTVWSTLWLLRAYGIIRSSWVSITLRLLQFTGVVVILGFCVWAIFTGISAVCSNSHGACWNNSTNQLNILFIVFLPTLVGVLVLVQTYLTYLTYRQTRQAEAAPPGDPSPLPPAAHASSSEDDDARKSPTGSRPLVPARRLVTLPPLTAPRLIEQREGIVKDVSAQLADHETNAVVLTGIGGAGKSTVAALVYRHEEKQRELKQSPFLADPLWLTISASVTMTELTSVLLELLDTPVPSIETLPPQQQALALFNALSATATPRLLVLDQFETLLNASTGQFMPERLGMGEWLEALNSRPARCRILFTSRFWPRGPHPSGRAYLQEKRLDRLSRDEGVALLRKQGVAESRATETELRMAVERCQGHPLSLALLASLLQRDTSLHLKVLLSDPFYAQMWKGEIAHGLLDYVYQQQLNGVQQRLLCAFSVYREAVPLQAAQALLTASSQEVLEAYEVLRTQHLLQEAGELLYRLHPIVVEYAWSHFDASSEQANQQALCVAHAGAAAYYVQAAQRCVPREKRRRVTDVQPIMEAIWHWCQAERWQEAYDLMNRERIFEDVNRWGGNTILLELCLQFFPLAQWHPERRDEALLYSRVAYLYNGLGQKQEALRYYQQALAIFQEVGDRGGEGTTLNNLGRVYDDLGQKQEALRYYQQALDIRKEVGDRGGEGVTLHNIGMLYFQEEQYDVALACFWLARLLCLDVQSPYVQDEEQMMAAILQKVGEQEFARLLAEIKTKAAEIIEQALQNDRK
ncbi:MAG TPA: tetratricopeptide repeat protein [Ktedonobacteraceae bacterium]|nr:tetratricopeptide repeat protein [Ktedonobacteraceae bacterium]